MNKRVGKLLKTHKVCIGSMLDAYNQRVCIDIACTITTRVNSSNHYWVVVKDEREV